MIEKWVGKEILYRMGSGEQHCAKLEAIGEHGIYVAGSSGRTVLIPWAYLQWVSFS